MSSPSLSEEPTNAAPLTDVYSGSEAMLQEVHPCFSSEPTQGGDERLRKRRRMRFTRDMDVTLVKSVKFRSAQVARHGKNEEHY